MQGLFLKAFRWYVVVVFAISGLCLLNLADVYNSIKPVLPAIVCLGMAFIFMVAWKEIQRKVLFYTLVLCAGLAYAAQYVPDILFVFTGIDTTYYLSWVALVTVPGIPVMMYVFHRHGD